MIDTLLDWIWSAAKLLAGLAAAGFLAYLVFLAGLMALKLLFPALFLAFLSWLFFDNAWIGAGLGAAYIALQIYRKGWSAYFRSATNDDEPMQTYEPEPPEGYTPWDAGSSRGEQASPYSRDHRGHGFPPPPPTRACSEPSGAPACRNDRVYDHDVPCNGGDLPYGADDNAQYFHKEATRLEQNARRLEDEARRLQEQYETESRYGNHEKAEIYWDEAQAKWADADRLREEAEQNRSLARRYYERD